MTSTPFHPVGFPLPDDIFNGGAELTPGGTGAGRYSLEDLLRNLETWVQTRGVVDTLAELPATAEDGQIVAVRNPTGPGSPPGLWIYDGDLTAWVNLLSTGLPANHKVTHQVGGSDQVSIQSLLGVPLTPIATNVLHVGPAGSGARFSSVQSAIDWAVANIPDGDPVGVLIAPGNYNEDVILRRNNTHFNGLTGGLGGTVIKSFTLTDCTVASVLAFNASGNFGDLVEDVALPSKPTIVTFSNLRFMRTVNVPAWVGDALFSFRVLAAPVAGNPMSSDITAWVASVFEQAAGVPGGTPGGLLIAHSNYHACLGCVVSGGLKMRNATQTMMFGSDSFETTEVFYNPALPEPFDNANGGIIKFGGYIGGLHLTGTNGRIQFFMGVRMMGVEVDSTGDASQMWDCNVFGAFNINNLGPTVVFYGGRYFVPIGGVGAAGFTGIVGFNS